MTTLLVASTVVAPSVARTTGILFDCMIPFDGDSAPQAQAAPAGDAGGG